MFLRSALLIASTLLIGTAQAEPTLMSNAYLFSCPFYQLQDSFDMNGVKTAVGQIIENKIKIREGCRAAIDQLSFNINATQALIDQQNQENQKKILSQLNSRFREDLSTKLLSLKSQGLGSSTEAVALDATIAASYNQELSQTLTTFPEIAAKNAENQLRGELYGNFKKMVSTIRTLQTQDCISTIGTIKDFTAPLLGIAATATGFTGSGANLVATSAIELISSVSSLLVDQKLRSAKRDLDRLDNDKLIACTYYALKYSTCEYQKARKLAEGKDQMIAILSGNTERKTGPEKDHPEFLELNYAKARIPLFQAVFEKMLSEGTSLSTSIGLLTSYIVAVVSNPSTIQLHDGTPGEGAKFDLSTPGGILLANQWINEITQKNIDVPESTYGVPNTLDQRISAAQTNIKNKRNTITLAESFNTYNQSFSDARDYLNNTPGLSLAINKTLLTLNAFIDGKYNTRLKGKNKNALYKAHELLTNMKSFMEVDIETVECPKDLKKPNDIAAELADITDPNQKKLHCFEAKLRESANVFFASMARGAYASATNQTVLIIPSKATGRIKESLKTIEQAFLREDKDQHRPYPESYAFFRDQNRMTSVVTQNYNAYALPKAFDERTYQLSFAGLEKAFSKEIKRMIKQAAKGDRTLFNEAATNENKGISSEQRLGQLCSLFASSLPNLPRGNHYLKLCKANAKNLNLYSVISKDPLPINYDDQCFFPNYQRLLTIQQEIVNQIPELDGSDPSGTYSVD